MNEKNNKIVGLFIFRNIGILMRLSVFTAWGCGASPEQSVDSDTGGGDSDTEGIESEEPEHGGSTESEDGGTGSQEEADDYIFVNNVVHSIHFNLTSEAIAEIDGVERPEVHATMTFNDMTFPDIGLRLKGNGSYRRIMNKPALIVDLNQWIKGTTLFGLKAFKLHNGLSYDPTRIHEYLSYEFARAAGMMAPRASWAEVWVNDNYMGLYTLSEKHDDIMLAKHNLEQYGVILELPDLLPDFGVGDSLNEAMILEIWEEGPLPPSQAVVDSLSSLDQQLRATPSEEATPALWKVVDHQGWLDYMAWEGLLGNQDSYTFSCNNWRIFVDGTSAKVFWVPSSADGGFGADIEDVFATETSMGQAGKFAFWCKSVSSCRRSYAERLIEMADLLEDTDLKAEYETIAKWLEPFYEKENEKWFSNEELSTANEATSRALTENPILVRQQVFTEYPDLE